VNGVTENSITIGWTVPPSDLKEHVHYYNLMATHADQKREAVYPAQPFIVYAFVDLDPATTYKFKIAACSEYTKQCGNWSAEVNGTTLDGGKKNMYIYFIRFGKYLNVFHCFFSGQSSKESHRYLSL